MLTSEESRATTEAKEQQKREEEAKLKAVQKMEQEEK